jgi:5-methylcytosine-specific restriction enzyme A
LRPIATYAEYQQWYQWRRWRKRRRAQLARQPLCVYCLKQGVIEVATVADHIIPHKGDWDLFWDGQLQSLCKWHHDSYKRQDELRGYASDIGLDGYPIDRKHPTYQFNEMMKSRK